LTWTAFATLTITFTVVATALAIFWFLYDEAIREFKSTNTRLDQTNVRLHQLASEIGLTNKRLSEFQDDFRQKLGELRNELRQEGQLQSEFRNTVMALLQERE
jgi:hypothetical protein